MASTNWRCSLCTHINDSNTQICELCSNQRDNVTIDRYGTRGAVGDCWTCSYNEGGLHGGQPTAGILDTGASFPTAMSTDHPRQATPGIGVPAGHQDINTNINQSISTVQQQRAPQVPVTGSRLPAGQQDMNTSSNQNISNTPNMPQQQRAPQVPVTDTEDTEIREMQRELQELERELEIRRMEDNRRNLRERLNTVRSELQRYHNDDNIQIGDTSLADSSLFQSSCTSDSTVTSTDVAEQTHVKAMFSDNEWVCRLCTLRNHNLVTVCSACENPRDQTPRRATTNVNVPHVAPDGTDWICSLCTLRNRSQVNICSACENPREQTPRRATADENVTQMLLPDSDSATTISTNSIASSAVSQNPDMSQLQWELEDLERRLNVARDNQNGTRSSVRRDLLSRLQNVRVQLGSDVNNQLSTTQRQNQEWDCSNCTFRNVSTDTECKICGNAREQVDGLHISLDTIGVELENIQSSGHTNSASQSTNDSLTLTSNSLRLVLIGATGTGKSSTGNTILGRNEFEASLSADSITRITKLRSAFRFNRVVNVVDTPGIFDTGADQRYIQTEILKCIGMTAPGPHAVLLIVNVSVRFSIENKESVSFFVSHFGDDLYKYLIVVFTRKDELERKNKTLDEYLERIPRELDDVLLRCNYRYIAINNDATDIVKDRQIQELFQIIDHMVQQNNNQFFTNDLYAETDRKVMKRMKKLYKELDQRRVTEIRAIRQAETARIEQKYQRRVMERQRAVGRDLTQLESDELRTTAIKEEKVRTRTLIDEVDSRLRPMMRRSELRRTAQREIEEERPGMMKRIGKGALKVLKGVGGGLLGVVASPFVAAGGLIATAASPFIFGVAATSSIDDSD